MSNERKQEQGQKPEQRQAVTPPVIQTGTSDVDLQGHLSRLEEQQKALEERLAVATRQFVDKGVLSPSARQAEDRLRQNQQETGE